MTLLRRYFDLLDRKPLPTKLISSLFIFSSSDVLAQLYEHASENKQSKESWSLQSFSLDIGRTMRITTFGGIATCWIHVWWNMLEKFVERRISSQTHHYSNAVVKVFLDQSLGAPVFNTIFFASQELLQGKPLDADLLETVATRVPVMLAKHYTFWPWVHLVNFSFVPLHKRILVQNVLAIGWGAYLSHCEEEFEKEEIESERSEPQAKSAVACSDPKVSS